MLRYNGSPEDQIRKTVETCTLKTLKLTDE